jgi:hypothetical protein
MNSSQPGTVTSTSEVTSVSEAGFSIRWEGRDLTVSFNQFPWFKSETNGVLSDFQEVSPGHFYWPQLDVDLTAEMIEHPHRFPRIAFAR